MATKTTNLNLEKPGRGEYTNSWDTPVNSNFQKVDDWAGEIQLEIQNARGTKSSLSDRLDVAMDEGGIPKPTMEIKNARRSYLYGNRINSVVVTEFGKINELRDMELWKARQQMAFNTGGSLLGGIGFIHSYGPNQILNGSKDSKGEPSWAGSTANKILVDGSVVSLVLAIAGKAARVRTSKEITLPSAGTFYVYAEYQEDGVEFITGSGTTSWPPGSDNQLENYYIFQDPTKNFITLGVKAGDVLRLTAPSLSGDYLIEEVHPGAISGQLKIVGNFPVGGAASSYSIIDPYDVILGTVTNEASLSPQAMTLVEAVSDGSAVVSYTPRHFGTTYVGDWRPVDVSTIPDFSELWNHRLGSENLEVIVQAKATLSSAWVETLHNTRIGNNLSVSVDISGVSVNTVNTLDVTSGTLAVATNIAPPDAHEHSVTGDPSLTGDVASSLSGGATASVSGSVYPENSVITAYTSNQVKVKNAVASKFFKDYDGVERTIGYIRVIVSKRG